MATRGSRDVKMTLSVETLGQDEILALKKAVEQLAAEGGEAAPEFQALADQIGRLGAQNEAVSNVKRLSEETAQLRERQESAAGSAAEMRRRLDELSQKAEEARASQERTSQALQQWKDVGTDASAALTTLIKTTDAAGKKTQEYKDEVARLILEKATAKKGSEELAAQLR
jgi:methyl-accepting chemotaxis protein